METDEFIVLMPVSNAVQAEELRVIRNECRNYMTRNTDIISKEQQFEWWNKLNTNLHKLYLVYKVFNGVACVSVGYGYIRIEDGVVLLTGGLIEQDRGKGYGKQLFSTLLENAKQFNLPIELELLKTNTKAFVVYNSLGFRVVGDDGNIIKMEYHYDSVI
jgi:ribosomal protein S18 acetylase RimI-like enzyme